MSDTERLMLLLAHLRARRRQCPWCAGAHVCDSDCVLRDLWFQKDGANKDLIQARLPAAGLEPTLLARLGFTVGPVIADDPIWRRVGFPDGWRVVQSSSIMWSDLVDPQGRRRTTLFHSAKEAFITPFGRRYIAMLDYRDEVGHLNEYRAVICDIATGQYLQDSPWQPAPDDYNSDAYDYYADATYVSMRAELLRQFPLADDVLAYW